MGVVAKVPEWDTLWAMYYDYTNFPDSAKVKSLIGGGVDVAWITNTCAVRLSDAFNYTGLLLPGNFPGMNTVKDGAGKRCAYRIAELRKWMVYRLGNPEVTNAKAASAAFDKTTLSSKKGIIEFTIAFGDATGHLDLWDGTKFSSEYKTTTDYWTSATRINLWECGK